MFPLNVYKCLGYGEDLENSFLKTKTPLNKPSLNPTLLPKFKRLFSHQMTRYLYILNLTLKEKTRTELIGRRKADLWLHPGMWMPQMTAVGFSVYFVTFQEPYTVKTGELSSRNGVTVSKKDPQICVHMNPAQFPEADPNVHSAYFSCHHYLKKSFYLLQNELISLRDFTGLPPSIRPIYPPGIN